ncbi:MAG: hypothetical protein Q8M15_02030 [Bacteroidota bacterium]|nr:hypothetical protein [Bacteroidota bacterium]
MKTHEKKRLSNAYHEAGHAIACLELGIPFKEISIIPNDDTVGRVLLCECELVRQLEEDDTSIVRLEAEKYIVALLAGLAAQTKFDSSSNRKMAGQDISVSIQIVNKLFTSHKVGVSFYKFMTAQTESMFDDFPSNEYPDATTETHDLESDAWKNVVLLVKTILEKDKLNFEQLIELFPEYEKNFENLL